MISIDSLIQKVQPLYVGSDPAHGLDHIRRIMAFCMRVGRQRGADLDLLLRAAAIHGIESEIVLRGKFDGEYDKITTLARNASKNPHTLEEKILWDANVVDSLGIVGLARAFTKGGFEGQEIVDTIRIIRRNMSRPLLTEEGKQIAVDRLKRMKAFLDRLEADLA